MTLQAWLGQRGRSGKLRKRHGAQARFGLFRKAGKDHRDMITRVTVSRARDDYSVTMNFAAIPWGLQRECHLGPRRKWSRTPKFNAIFVDNHCIRREGQTRLACLNCHLMQGSGKLCFSRAHTTTLVYHHLFKDQGGCLREFCGWFRAPHAESSGEAPCPQNW